MTTGRTRLGALLGTAALLVATAGCSGSEDTAEDAPPASPPAVELSPDGVPESVDIGVIVSLGTDPGQGSQWNEAAEGARVAAYRYGLGDAEVNVLARDDSGTENGAREAVSELAEAGVSGIVLASEGDHILPALTTASEAGIPVLLPYADTSAELPDGVWATGPDAEQVGSVLAGALSDAGAHRPMLVDLGGGQVPGVKAVKTVRMTDGTGAVSLAGRIARRSRGAEGADAVVVSGPAPLQAQVVQALQARDSALPVFLTGDALSPAFPVALSDAGGSLTTPLTTAGLDTDDVAALEPGNQGAAVSAYLSALRVTAEDGDVSDFFDDQLFETVAGAADVRSHDAVVALVAATAAAQSTEPAEVRTALSSLTVDQGDGLAGPDLDFGAAATVPDDAVVPLQATTQDPGLRPPPAGTPVPKLYWFEAPSA